MLDKTAEDGYQGVDGKEDPVVCPEVVVVRFEPGGSIGYAVRKSHGVEVEHHSPRTTGHGARGALVVVAR